MRPASTGVEIVRRWDGASSVTEMVAAGHVLLVDYGDVHDGGPASEEVQLVGTRLGLGRLREGPPAADYAWHRAYGSIISPVVTVPHTAGWWLEDLPGTVVYFCLPEGGSAWEVTLVSVERLVGELRVRFTAAEFRCLWDRDACTFRGGPSRTVGWLLEGGADADSGYPRGRFPPDPRDADVSPMAMPAYDFCREFVRREENQETVLLSPGQCVVVPNGRVLTGGRWHGPDHPADYFVRPWFT